MSHDPSRDPLKAALAALDGQRASLGDAVVDAAQAALRAELAQRGEAHQQLKQVTLLFVDVVGSTAMGRRLDPESVFAIMDRALARFAAIVEAHRGRVMNFTGDGLLAAFGSEVVHEADVESAVLAGLALIDDAHAWAPEVREQHGVATFDVRVGIHTGTALVGGGVQADAGIRGDAVNVAARMEQSAPAGRLRISHESYRHVRGRFDVVEQPPIQVKGVDAPLRTYLVERANPRGYRVRGIDGVSTPLIGRRDEIALLDAALGVAVAERRRRAVTVFADAGVGKSRLAADFLASAEPGAALVMEARAHPRSAEESCGLVRDLFLRHAGIGDDEPLEQARAKLEQTYGTQFALDREASLARLGHMIGLDYADSEHVRDLLSDEATFRARAFDAAVTVLRSLAGRQSLIVLFDDLHWADDGSIAFLRHLLRSAIDVPMLVLMLARPAFLDAHPAWVTVDAGHERVDLPPLDDASRAKLADALLCRIADVPAALRDSVTRAGEGNPFAMEELVNLFVDDGAIRADADGWHVDPAKLSVARVPSTIAGILQARLDALPAPARVAAQRAAVIGHIFWDAALSAVDPSAIDALPVLIDKQIVQRRSPSSVDGADEFAFQHHLLHQVTYDSVLRAAKRDGHARVGAFWSERAHVSESADVTPASCRALTDAHYHRSRSDPADCADWFDDVFTVYNDAYAGRMLLPLAEREVDHCQREFGADHLASARALTNLARTLVMLGRTDDAEPLVRRAVAVQERLLPLGDPGSARTLAVLAQCSRAKGDLPAARDHLRRVLTIRERSLGPDDPMTLGVRDNLAKILLEMGELDEAEPLFRSVLDAFVRRHGSDHSETAFAMTALGEVLAKRGRVDEAEAMFRRALAVQERLLHDRHPELGLTLWHLAVALRSQARHLDAEGHASRALAIWEDEFGAQHEWTGWGLVGLAEVRLALGRPADAATLASRATGILERALGATHPEVASTLELHARALLARADPRSAEALLERAWTIRTSTVPANETAVLATGELLRQARERRERD